MRYCDTCTVLVSSKVRTCVLRLRNMKYIRASPPLTQFLFQWSNWTISSPKMSKKLKKRTSPVGTDEQILRRCGAISVLRRNFWAVSGRNCAAEQILRRVCSLSFRPIRPELTNRIISRAKFKHNVTELRSVRRIWSISTSTVCISHIRHTASSLLVDGQWKIQQGLNTWSPIYWHKRRWRRPWWWQWRLHCRQAHDVDDIVAKPMMVLLLFY